MGLFDFLGGGSPAEKAQRLKSKVTQKYGDAVNRQKAIDQLGDMGTPEAVAVLLHRFTINVDPGTTDADEKDIVFNQIVSVGKDAIPPIREFLRRQDQASSWMLKLLDGILTPTEVLEVVCDELDKIGGTYARDPEKKIVMLHYLEGKQSPRIADIALKVLEDMADDVKLSALKVLAPLKHEPAREPLLKLLTDEETGKRVQTAALNAIADSEFTVQGYREKVEARLPSGWFVDKSGAVKKRGEA
jgi:HEAT repeat protein